MLKDKTAKRPRSHVIANQLREQILQGDLELGSRLRQDALATQFGVSHIPVREALRQLAAEGLVTIRPQHGAEVSGVSPGDVTDLLEVRALLELKAVKWAINNADDETFERAEAILRRAEAAEETSEWMECNWLFHRCLYECGDRPWLCETIQALNVRIERTIRLLLSLSDYRAQAEAEHRAILAAFRVRNEVAVCALLTQHLDETSNSLSRLLKEYETHGSLRHWKSLDTS
jgi:DNA-binding GntR family transcriptional regulator